MKTITSCLEKGGSAKTTTNHAIAAGLATKGYKVLLVDLDPQANLSQTVGADFDSPSTYELLLQETTAQEAIQEVGNLSIIPAIRNNSNIELLLREEDRREYRLKDALKDVEGDFDFCIIDTPPALGLLTINALTAAQNVVIPTQASSYAYEGIKNLYRTIQSVRQHANDELNIAGILLTRYNPRTTVGKVYSEELEGLASEIGTRLFDTTIRSGVVVDEAQTVHQDIFSYAPKSKVAEDYSRFVDELLKEI